MMINAVLHHSVDINPLDAVMELKLELGFKPCNRFMRENDGVLEYGEDISYHGSPFYKYTEFSNNPNWIELYKGLNLLEDYLKHSDDPKWQKHLENQKITTQGEIDLEVMQAQNTLFRHDLPGGKRAVFDDMDLMGFDFSNMDFTGASFRNVCLESAILKDASMCFCDFTGANFTDANLRGIVAEESDFTGAVFLDTLAAYAYLNGSDLTDCDFSGADLTRTKMNSCKIDGANFSRATMEDTEYNFELPEFREDSGMEIG